MKRKIKKDHSGPGFVTPSQYLKKVLPWGSETLKMTAQERVCVLSFVEMNVDSRICYDQAEDRILGPHSNVQVVMVRGLFAKWKQPIYFDFDVRMTAALLKDIIVQLENIGYNVVAVVADLGGKKSLCVVRT